MASYQIDCGYPTVNQFLTSSHHANAGHHPLAQSPLAATTLTSNASSISPSPAAGAELSTTSSNSDSSVGTLTPDAVSQSSALGSSATNSASASACAGLLDNASAHPYTLTALSGGAGAPMLAMGGAGNMVATPPGCCDNGRPMVTDPVTGQTICSCQYDSSAAAAAAAAAGSGSSRLAALGSYTRLATATPTMAGVGMSVFGSAYPSNDQNPYPSIAVETAAPFYTSLNTPYALKDTTSSASAWTSTALQPSGYYAYDPTFGACGFGAGYDLAARRKNATRESTANLKQWLNDHIKNPYPTKGEKIMLAIITKMTLTQVSTWFANARRRLKKENKMTWEPKTRTEDEDAMVSDDEKVQDPEDSSNAAAAAGPQTQRSMNSIKKCMDSDVPVAMVEATGVASNAMGLRAGTSGMLSIGPHCSSGSGSGSARSLLTASSHRANGGVTAVASAGIGSSVVGADLGPGPSNRPVGPNVELKDPYQQQQHPHQHQHAHHSHPHPQHLTLPQNLQQYSSNFYYSNTTAAAAAAAAAVAAANQPYQHSHHSQAAAGVAAATASGSPPASLRSSAHLSYDNSSLLMPQHHTLLSSSYAMERR